jgi:uncharacterized metal-binding protein YceD (DUF177 family)
MEALKLYNIRFTGLKNGFHDFDYEIKGDFFKAFEGSLIQEAELKVALTLERKTNGLDLHFKTTGFLTLPCDRCLQAVNVPVSDESELLVKFSANPAESTESIWYLPTTAWEINVGQYLYETLNLLMPLRVSCEVGESGHCQSDFESLMQKYDGSKADSEESSDVDPRWEKLKNLKLN